MPIPSESNSKQPEDVILPEDVKEFLFRISDHYVHHDIDQIMNCVSDSFLHQGLSKKDFETCLRGSYILSYLNDMKITILKFIKEKNIAVLTGFAVTDLGVVPASDPSVPLIEGTRLILEGGEWKLLGNQSKSNLGLYNVFHQLSVYFVPSDNLIYRSLLPEPLEMPSKPAVFVKITDFEQVRMPLPPYKVAHIQILAEHKGFQGWYTLTMPETEWIPVEMGKTIGYPKYVADFISFAKTQEGWEAKIINRGTPEISMTLKYEEDLSRASWFERMTRNHPLSVLRKILPPFREKPWFLRMPVGKEGPGSKILLLKGDPPVSGIPGIYENFGTAKISLRTNQPWGNLFPQEITARGIFMRFTGELILRHKLIEVIQP